MDYKDEVAGIFQWLCGIARKFCSSAQDCEDLAMYTVERLLVCETSYDGRPLKPWAYSIMQNRYIDVWRRMPYTEMVDIEELESVGHVNYDACSMLSAVYHIAEGDTGVRCAVMFAEGHSYEEVAAMEGLTEKAVKSRINRGRERLRKTFAYDKRQ